MICPKCGSRMRPDMANHGNSIERTADHGKFSFGWSCYCCGKWIDHIKVVMPEIPPREFEVTEKFINGQRGKNTKQKVALDDHFLSIKFWMFNGATLVEAHKKLLNKGLDVSYSTFQRYMAKKVKEAGKGSTT